MALISDDQVGQFRESGYFLTDPAFDEETLREAGEEFDRLHREDIAAAEGADNARRLELARYRPFIGQAHTRSEALARLVKSPIYLEACARLIGPDADLYYNQAVLKPPERGRAFGWHQDSGYTTTKPLEYVTCWTAISRTFVENGCIWVIPGSHRRGVVKHVRDEARSELVAEVEDEARAIPVEMAPGQVAVFSSLLLHRSGPNVSNETRRGYVPQYHHPDVIKVDTGLPWGDRYPILRGGRPA